MSRWRFLPSYHYEDNTDGKIDNPAVLQLRDYTIAGNCGENILTYPYANTTGTRYGVTFTDNGDGSITVSGTATSSAYFAFIRNIPVNKGDTFTLRANSQDKANMKIGISRYKSESSDSLIQEISVLEDVYTYTVKDDETKYISVFVKRDKDGMECTGTFKPELLKGKVGDYSTAAGKYEIPIKICGKNMLSCPSEFTWTGTNHKEVSIPPGKYILSWSSSILGGSVKPVIRFEKNNIVFALDVSGGQKLITLTKPETDIHIYSNGYDYANSIGVTSTVNGLMLERGTVATAYEPYTEPRTQTISLDNPVGIGESVSMRADNLPAITLNKGSNIITVETDITPTGVTYQYYTY